MIGVSAKWGTGCPTPDTFLGKTSCVEHTTAAAVKSSDTAATGNTPKGQVVAASGDGMAFLQMAQISLEWNQILDVGAGLSNLGNTCFLNAALQCLSYTAPLANYMLSQEHSKTCLEPEFCMMCIMENHMIHLFASSGNTIAPTGVLHELQRIATHFHLGHQEDAHEFLHYIIGAMQMSCLLENVLLGQSEAPTFVHRVFGGWLRSRLTCLNCKAVSDTFESFLDFSLEIKTARNIRQAFEQFVTPDVLDGENAYKCSKCNEMAPASKRFTIHESPNVLTICLKRFSEYGDSKIVQNVRYPEHLDIGPFMSQADGERMTYHLYAVLVHSGLSCQTGHYYCYIKASKGQWYKMNDASVILTDLRTALSQQAYILFYIRSSDVQNGVDYHNSNGMPDQFSFCAGFVGPQLAPSKDSPEELSQGSTQKTSPGIRRRRKRCKRRGFV